MQVINTMKGILTKIRGFFALKTKLPNIDKENLEKLISYIIPEYWASNKKSFILFWLIGSFTVIFIFWASIAKVNQVVRASGTVVPDSKVHLVQSGVTGPIEEINIKLDDKVQAGDVLFHVDTTNRLKNYKLSKKEFETRSRRVNILKELVSTGSDSEFRLLDEELMLVDAESRYNDSKKSLEYSKVKSPITGYVSKINVTNKEQIVQSGDLLSEIVPLDDVLKIEAKVAPKDIAYVRKGQKAKIAFSAYDMAIYGQFEGEVTKIAANTSTTKDGDPFYPAVIELNNNQFTDSDKKIILQSGMLSDVSIIGEERTVMSYVLNPITKLSQTALQE
jgi:adhesin transport system membrane fusion protein